MSPMTSNSHTSEPLLHRDPTQHYPVMVRGEGIYLYDADGRRYVDGTAGATNVTLGHGRGRIADAMAQQARQLAYCFSTQFTNEPALQLAQRLAALAPGDLNHVYFVSGGSEAIETAIKLARMYHLQRGAAGKHKVIARWRSYHGATLGALSLTGLVGMRTPYAPWLAPFPHIASCYPYRCTFAGCAGSCNLSCAGELERAIQQEGAENVAAFVAEPVVMGAIAAGAAPPEYFREIRAICDRYDVLFIADEIITGMGRTGTWFAIEHSGVVPDMITFAKGISSGYSPLGGVLFGDRIRAELTARGGPFPHIFTAVNNPVAARAGLEVLDILEEEGVLRHVQELGRYLAPRWEQLGSHPLVGETRGLGLLWGLELVRDKATHEPFPAAERVSPRLSKLLLDRGVSLAVQAGCHDFVSGDDVRFSPPLIITREQVDEVLAILAACLDELAAELAA
ncbi:MAG: aspartate aminotransferase family protein [Spirochaetaceae bacterium]|nr:aspartate aminotransferase family protein [Spirochaetaceae bacterium]